MRKVAPDNRSMWRTPILRANQCEGWLQILRGAAEHYSTIQTLRKVAPDARWRQRLPRFQCPKQLHASVVEWLVKTETMGGYTLSVMGWGLG